MAASLIGVISHTHGLLRSEALAALRGCDLLPVAVGFLELTRGSVRGRIVDLSQAAQRAGPA